MMKKHRTNKQGIGNLGLVLSTLIIGIIILLVAMMVLLPNVFGGLTGGYDPPLDDGDTDQTNPIFAYFSVSVVLRWDNNELNNHVIYGMDSLTVTVNTEKGSGLSFFDNWGNPLDWFNGHECKYSVQFKITGPTSAGYSYSHTLSGQQFVGANQEFTTTHNMGTSPGIRYEGVYHVTATLIDGDGGIVSTLDKDVSVSK